VSIFTNLPQCGSLRHKVKREIIGFGEIQKEREERIEKLKAELKEIKIKYEEVDLHYGTLTI
jgi:archaellum component FlaC